MIERAKKYLFDILFSIEAIEDFLQDVDFSEYQKDFLRYYVKIQKECN